MPDLDRGEALLARTAAVAGGKTLTLARAVSLAVRVEPGLLRLARRRLLPGSNAGVESDLWFSPLVLTHNAGALVLDPDALAVLRKELADGAGGEGLAEAAHKVVCEAHAGYPDALQLEEDLVWEALLAERDPGRESKLELRLREAVKAMVTDGDDGRWASQWAAQATRRMPAAALGTEAAGMLAIGAALRLGTAAPAAGLGSMPANVRWLAPSALGTPVRVGVELSGTTLRFVEPSPDEEALDLPPGNPLLAELSWSDGKTSTVRMERIAVGREVELGRVFGAITLRTLTGRRYTIAPVLARAEADSGWQRTATLARLEQAVVAVRAADGRFATGYVVEPELIATAGWIEVAEVLAGGRRLPARVLVQSAGGVGVLRVPGLPAVEPLEADPLDAPIEDGAEWLSCGFPDGAGATRAITGTVAEGRFLLADPMAFPGLAGAPVLIGGRLIGQVESLSSDGAISVVPIAEIRNALGRGRSGPRPEVYIGFARDVDPSLLDELETALLNEFLTPLRGRVEAGRPWRRGLIEQLFTCDAAVVLVSRDRLTSEWAGVETDTLRLRRSLDPTFTLLFVLMDDDGASRELLVAAGPHLAEQLVTWDGAAAVVSRLEGLTTRPDRRALLRRLQVALEPVPGDALARAADLLAPEQKPDAAALQYVVPLALLARAGDVGRIVTAAEILVPRLGAADSDFLLQALSLVFVRAETATALRRAAERHLAVLVDAAPTELVALCAELAWLEGPSRGVVTWRAGDADAEADMARPLARMELPAVAILAPPLPDTSVIAELRQRRPDQPLVLIADAATPREALARLGVEPLGLPLTVAPEAETYDALMRLRFLRRPAGRSSHPAAGRDEYLDELLQRFRPLLRYDSQETYLAMSAATMTDNVSTGGVPNRLLRADGTVIASAAPSGDEPLLNLEFLGGTTYANGASVRDDDHLEAARGTSAADARRFAADPAYADRIYGRAFQSADTTWLQYWLFFYYDDRTFLGFGAHEGDWQLLQLQIGPAGEPLAAVYGGGGPRVHAWDRLEKDASAPVVYVGRGSHWLHSRPGTHSRAFARDVADGKGPEHRPEVELPSAAATWLSWPGRWGATRSRVPAEPSSPVGPAFQRPWRDPASFQEEAERD